MNPNSSRKNTGTGGTRKQAIPATPEPVSTAPDTVRVVFMQDGQEVDAAEIDLAFHSALCCAEMATKRTRGEVLEDALRAYCQSLGLPVPAGQVTAAPLHTPPLPPLRCAADFPGFVKPWTYTNTKNWAANEVNTELENWLESTNDKDDVRKLDMDAVVWYEHLRHNPIFHEHAKAFGMMLEAYYRLQALLEDREERATA